MIKTSIIALTSFLLSSPAYASDTCYALMMIPNQYTSNQQSPQPKFIYGYTSLDIAREAKRVILGGEDSSDKAARIDYEASPAYKVDQKRKAQEEELLAISREQRKIAYCKSHDCSKGYNWWEHESTSILSVIQTGAIGMILPYSHVEVFPAPCVKNNE